MFENFVWILIAVLLFWILIRKTRRKYKSEIPLFPLPRYQTVSSVVFKGLSLVCLFSFCLLWTSSVLEVLFPQLASQSYLLSLYPSQLKPRFSYTATLFILDHSSSMKTPITQSQSRFMMAKDVIKTLIADIDVQGKGNDEFGLMQCARLAPIIVPMTRNRNFFLKTLNDVKIEERDFLNGSGLGYALFKGVFLLVALEEYAKENDLETLSHNARSIVIITDGLEDPHPLDRGEPYRSMRVKEALVQAQNLGIRVWYLVVNPYFATDKDFISAFARDQLREEVQKTGGEYVEVSSDVQQRTIGLQKLANQCSAVRESVQQPIDREVLLAIKLLLMLACVVGMRFSEHLYFRLG